MKKTPLVLITKWLLDFMFFSGVAIAAGVPWLFRLAGRYYSIFSKYYAPFCIIFMVSGVFALWIIRELRSMFRTVVKADPFVRENVRSLKRMGNCAFIIALLMSAKLVFVITPATLVLIAVFLVAGLFSLVLSQVFDEAVTFKQENDLTI